MADFSHSFSPIIGDAPRVLILGTLPSKVSLKKQEYYGHPRNHFWPIVYALFGDRIDEEYDQKVAYAKAHHIAVWDVCFTALRPGSLDADISAEVPNRITELLVQCPTITTIAFNGKKSEQLYFKYFKKREDLRYMTLLSSSPANAVYSFEQKQQQWQQLL